jgi:hypothetical protein
LLVGIAGRDRRFLLQRAHLLGRNVEVVLGLGVTKVLLEALVEGDVMVIIEIQFLRSYLPNLPCILLILHYVTHQDLIKT